MGKLRLTPRRLRILRAARNSDIGRASFSYFAGMSQEVWRENAVDLADAGLLAPHKVHDFVITDAGRAALKEAEG